MKTLMPFLTFLFHLLEMTANAIVLPFTILAAIGLIAFTYEIARQLKTERRSLLNMMRARTAMA